MARADGEAARVPRGVLAAVAAPSVPLAALTLPLAIYLPEYYSNALGFSLAGVAAAFMIVRLVDIAFDPLVGAAMDSAGGVLGSRKTWLALSAPLILLATWQIFFAKPHGTVAFLSFWLVVLYAGYSIAVLSQLAIGAHLSQSYVERSRVYAWWQGGNVAGQLLAQMLPIMLSGAGDVRGSVSVPAMGWLIIVMTPIAFALTFAFTPDVRHAEPPRRAGLRDYWRLLGFETVRRLIVVDLLLGLSFGIPSAVLMFFFTIVKQLDRAHIAVLVISYLLLSITTGPFWTGLSSRIGKHRSLACATLLFTISFGLVWLVPPGKAWLMTAAYSVGGLAYAAITLLPRAMMADVSDEVRLRTGEDRTALLFALLVGTYKVGSALSVGVVFWMLDFAGFSARAGAQNSKVALTVLEMIYFLPPIILCVISALIIWRFPLTAARHAEIQAQLENCDQTARCGSRSSSMFNLRSS